MARVRAQEKRLLVGFVADSEQPNAPINCLEGIAYRAKPDSSASYRGIDSVDRGPFVNEAGCEKDGLGLDFAARVKRRETFRRPRCNASMRPDLITAPKRSACWRKRASRSRPGLLTDYFQHTNDC
jgi:hypothetical protein